eukprot:COSAG02_NODE_424_length_22575_cov_79.088361_12_plen_52_part_00
MSSGGGPRSCNIGLDLPTVLVCLSLAAALLMFNATINLSRELPSLWNVVST